ncbi:MAG: amidohydrolase family protein [Cyanothece sp. SIO1E1]|nr:amidohydrolase family protein [Cyanothece sp. SIO1E1]
MVLAANVLRIDSYLTYLLCVSWVLFAPSLQGQSQQEADVLLTNGQIYTMAAARNKVQALAIKAGQIIFTGPNQSAQAYIGSDTEVINLENKMVLPGFTDSHIHPIGGGTRLMNCDLTDLRTAEEVLEKIRSYAQANPSKEWIIGGGLWLPAIDNGQPSATTLDKIVSNSRRLWVSVRTPGLQMKRGRKVAHRCRQRRADGS